MAIKKENAPLTATGGKLRDKKSDGLIRVRRDLKEKGPQKNYEAGINPQDEQFNTQPESQGESLGTTKPGGGNRIHSDKRNKDTKK